MAEGSIIFRNWLLMIKNKGAVFLSFVLLAFAVQDWLLSIAEI